MLVRMRYRRHTLHAIIAYKVTRLVLDILRYWRARFTRRAQIALRVDLSETLLRRSLIDEDGPRTHRVDLVSWPCWDTRLGRGIVVAIELAMHGWYRSATVEH